jgi:prepilin-type N-terminal cleavage/methylation domain-containing protein
MRKQQGGFTLIEIAIVLVIIGLLLGGVLKGQELITAARVRNLISTQDGVKAAYFGFLDRYRALPGDFGAAATTIPGCNVAPVCVNGNSNGQINANGTGTPAATIDEQNATWEHLSKAGFITGNYAYAAGAPAAGSTPTNPYGSFNQLIFDTVYREGAADAGTSRHNLKTGANIPSDILAEVDRKVDDGQAGTGTLRHSIFGASGTFAECTAGTAWAAQTPFANCGAAMLF